MSYTEPRSIARFARFHEGDTKNIVINGGFFAMSAELRSGHNNNTTCSVFCQVIFLTEYGYVIVFAGLTGFGVILKG